MRNGCHCKRKLTKRISRWMSIQHICMRLTCVRIFFSCTHILWYTEDAHCELSKRMQKSYFLKHIHAYYITHAYVWQEKKMIFVVCMCIFYCHFNLVLVHAILFGRFFTFSFFFSCNFFSSFFVFFCFLTFGASHLWLRTFDQKKEITI